MADHLWYVGVILCVIASFINIFGINVQKFSYMQKEEHEAAATEHPYYLDFVWWIGMVLIIFGVVLDLAALAFAAQSMIAPLSGLSLVFNLVTATCFLKEQVRPLDLVGTALLILGCTFAVVFANHTAEDDSFGEILRKADCFMFWFFFVDLIAFGVCVYLLIQKLESERSRGTQWYTRWHQWLAVSYAWLAASAGAVSVTTAKAIAELLKGEINDEHAGTFKKHYLTAPTAILLLLGSLLFQVHYLNLALERFDAVLIVPVYQGFWILLTACAGLVTYRELNGLSVSQAIAFLIGVAVTFLGVYFLSRRPAEYSEAELEDGGLERRLLEKIDDSLDKMDDSLDKKDDYSFCNVLNIVKWGEKDSEKDSHDECPHGNPPGVDKLTID